MRLPNPLHVLPALFAAARRIAMPLRPRPSLRCLSSLPRRKRPISMARRVYCPTATVDSNGSVTNPHLADPNLDGKLEVVIGVRDPGNFGGT